MEKLLEYLVAALTALFAIFGKKFPTMTDETKDNLGSMYDNITGYEPEV